MGWLWLLALIIWPIGVAAGAAADSDRIKLVAAFVVTSASLILGTFTLMDQLTHPTSQFAYDSAYVSVVGIAVAVIFFLLRQTGAMRNESLDVFFLVVLYAAGIIVVMLFAFGHGGNPTYHYVPEIP